MVAQILLGSPLAQYITPTPLGFSVFHLFLNFNHWCWLSDQLIKDFKTNLKPFYDNYL